MQKTEAAMILAGVQSEENREASAPTNLHVITGTVVETSESGKAKVSLDGLIFSADNEQSIEIDTLGGLEEGDTATILLSGESGHGMLPMAIGAGGSVDRVVERVKGIEADYVKATLLEAQVAQIGFLKADSATITNLQTQTAKIESLTAEQLSAATAYIAALTAGSITAESLTADVAKVHNLTADQLSAAAGYISQLTADSVTAQNISAMYGDFATVKANAAKVANLTAQELEADHAAIASLDSNYAHITNGVIDNATIGYADVNNLSAHYAEIQNGHINSALINTAAIVDEQVFTVTGNKATLASIDASKINVTNLNADNITVNKINGQTVTGKSISDALTQHETDILTKVDTTTFNNTIGDLNDRIDGAIETFTGTVVPTLNNTPASAWNTTKLRDEHVGDVYYVVNSSSQQNGYCYRFTKSGSTYSWQLIKDSDVTAALSRLQTAEGKITTFGSDISTLKTDTGELKTKTQSLETSLGDKVDVTTFNELSSDVDENSATLTTLSNTVSQKADSSTVTTLSNTVNQVKQTADTNKTSITNLTQTVNQKADGSTVTTLTQRTSTIEQNLSGITTRVSATESSISGHPDCWRIDRYSRPARVNTNTVVPVPDDFVEENFLDTRYRKESDMGTNLNIDNYYVAKLTTYVHATAATTITDDFQHDDASAVYLNDDHIAEAAGTTVISVTLNLRAGWNKIRFLLNEQTGSDYARFATRISTWSNVDQQVADFDEYEGTIQEQRLKTAETSIIQNEREITLSASRGLQLVGNGNGAMGDATNWPGTIFDGTVANASAGSFTVPLPAGYSRTVISEDMFPVDQSKEYVFEFDAISEDGTARLYAFLQHLDADKKSIGSNTVYFYKNTLTTLASDLNPGDTTIKLTSAANWRTTSAAHQRAIVFWDYKNSYGYLYPEETYSQNWYSDLYADDSKVDKSTGVITLKSAWTGPKKVAGTKLSQNYSGGYLYVVVNEFIPSTWTHYRFVFSGINDEKTGGDVLYKFRQATAYARPGFLWNYGGTTSNPQGQLWITNISVKENVATQTWLDAAKAEIKVTTDGISSEVNKISSAKYVNARATSWTLANLRTYASEGHQENWNVDSTDGLRVGDVVYVKGTDGTRNVPIYVKTTVKSVQNATNFTGISHGMEDILPVDSAISSINQSAESVKIQANRIEIDGTTVFTSGTTLANYVSGTANTAVNNLQIGGRNLIGKFNWDNSTQARGYDWYTISATGVVSSNSTDGTACSYDNCQWHAMLEQGTYQLTVFVDTPCEAWAAAQLAVYTSAGTHLGSIGSEVWNNGGKKTISFTLSATTNIGIKIKPGKGCVCRLKLESGTKASDWTPAPEDQEAYVDTKVGGRNYILRSAGLNTSGLGSAANSRAEYRALNVGQSFMSIAHGTQVTISFDLYMTVNTANPILNVYNTSNKGPKSFSNNPKGTGSNGGVTLNFTAAAGSVIDKRVSVTGYINDRTSPTLTTNWLEFYSNYGTSNWFSISNLKMEIGSNATAWSPAPEDAVKRTQRIYYRKSVTGVPAAPSSWVVSSGDGSNAWTQKHISISNTDKYIYTCEQYEMADGTLGYTSILLDDTITVIDGGNIITNSITANKIQANSLTLGQISTDAQSSILNSNVQVGSRNLLRKTATLEAEDCVMVQTTVVEPGVFQITPTTSAAYFKFKANYLDYADYGDGEYTLSCEAKLADVETSYTSINLNFYIGYSDAEHYDVAFKNNAYHKYVGIGVTNASNPVTDSWQRFSVTFNVPERLTTGSLVLADGVYLSATLYCPGSRKPVLVRHVKLEKGNKASDWSPAPEDMATQAGMESRISNEISTVSDDFTGQLGELSGKLSGFDESLKGLEGAIAADKTIRDNWIRMDKDGIFVGSQSEAADYGVGIDADSVDFMVGGERAAYASAAAFVPKALRLGDYVLSGSGGYLYIDYDPLT